MVRWRSRVLTAISLLLLAVTLLLGVRSYWVAAHISFSRTTFLPPTPEDREYARSQGYAASSVVTTRLRALSLSRGALIYEHWNRRDVISIWDEPGSRRVARAFDGWKWLQTPPGPPPSAAQSWWSRLGFGYHVQRDATPTGNPFYSVSAGLWLVAVLAAILPLMRVLSWWQGRRRYGAGLCPRCGYDLRSTPDRCPECGTVIRSGAVAQES